MMKVSIGKLFCLLILILIVVLVSVLGIHYAYSCEPPLITTKWGANDVLLFYGSLLAFIGTLSLGILALYQNSVFKKDSDENQAMLRELSIAGIEDKRVHDITNAINRFTKLSNLNAIINIANKQSEIIFQKEKELPQSDRSYSINLLYINAAIIFFDYYENLENIYLEIVRKLEQDVSTDKKIKTHFNEYIDKKYEISMRYVNHYIKLVKKNKQITHISSKSVESEYRDIHVKYIGFKQNYLLERNRFINKLIFREITLDKFQDLLSQNQEEIAKKENL